MIDQSLLPSRQLKLFARIARWSLRLLLAFWLLVVALWGALHYFIVPRISEWRPEVEHMVSQALGVPVRIASIEGQADGLLPKVHLQGLSLLDPQGREALKLQTVIVTISARSVLRLGLEQLYVEAPEIAVRHMSDGSWQIAGFPIVPTQTSDSRALRWLLEQPELLIRKGVLNFTDEQNANQPMQLHNVEFVLRNHGWRHNLRLEASPAGEDGERLQLMGDFRDALLPASKGAWHHWTGQWYANLHLHRIPSFPLPPSWAIHALQGQGHTRLWVDIKNGHPFQVTADVVLPRAKVQWSDPAIADLAVEQVNGRLHIQQQGSSWQVEGNNFSFRHGDGSFWPSSNWAVRLHTEKENIHGVAVEVDYADMAMATKVVQSLPLPEVVKRPFSRWMPEGEIRQLDMQWKAAGTYQIKGEISNLALKPQEADHGIGTPGVERLYARFSLNQHGGQALLRMRDGIVHFPGVFEDPALPLQQLDANLRWNIQDGHLRLEVPEAIFANTDAQGELHGWWQMGHGAQERFPGELHLQGKLNRADGARVHRYLPMQIPEVARHYVRDSIRQGQGRNVEFEVKGMLKDMPFNRPGTGRFYIHAPVKNVIYAFVPPASRSIKEPTWPALTGLSGNLIFEGTGMSVQQAQSGFEGHPKLHMGAISAHIPDLEHPVLHLHALGHLEMASTLALVRGSPLSQYTSHALDDAQAKGNASVGFDLELPMDRLEQSKVQGKVVFQDTALQFSRETPWLHRLRGSVQFSEQGFALDSVKGQSLGGTFELSGGMPSPHQGVQIKARGTATAQGMQQEQSMALLQDIAAYAEGAASYSVDITALEGKQQIAVHSDLRNMALHLPAPFNKPEAVAWPLTVKQTLSEDQVQTLEVAVPDRLQVMYVQDPPTLINPEVRGRIVIGTVAQQNAAVDKGISAHVNLDALDGDAWLAALSAYESVLSSDAASTSYLPQHIQLDVQKLRIKDRQLEAIKADFQETKGTWSGHLSAKQFAGYVEYRRPEVQADSGRIFARLSHLSIPKTEVQRLHDAPADEVENGPNTLPALDIEVENLEVAEKALGKLLLQARNTAGTHGRDWMLEQLNLTTPEARWKANGSWSAPAQGAPRKTHLSFLLEIESSGKLLERLGAPGLIRDGKGRLNGNVAWLGSPLSPDWHSMDGGVHMEVEKGQFLKVEPGMGKLLSVLSLQSLSRRVNLDFRDLFSQGFAFDFIRGDIAVEQGLAHTNNLQMRGLNAAVLMEGRASLVQETQDLKVVVVPEINAMTASLAATAINPVVGLGSFLAQMFLRGPLMEAATRTFHIHGTWADPIVQPLSKSPSPPLDGINQGKAP